MTATLPHQRLLALGAALLSVLGASCAGTHRLADPTLRMNTTGGSELGVSTEYGVVFLGSTAQAGDVQVMAWYGDGPSIEDAVIEPIGGRLYTAETEIRLPSVPLSFVDPLPGQQVLLVGRKGTSETWQKEVKVLSDPRVEGILLGVPSELRNAPDQVGAGVYFCPDDDCRKKRLIGLVAGKIRLDGEGGAREYLAVVGPSQLWRLVTHRRDRTKHRPLPNRADIL